MAPPFTPSARYAAAIFALSSRCVMPSRSVANAALYAAIVMSLARCISAISAGDLIIRHPAVTASALTYSVPAVAWRSPSNTPNGTRSSMPILVIPPRSARACAAVRYFSAGSFQIRASPASLLSGGSGATHTGAPAAGSTHNTSAARLPVK